jgi:hypothetical protein
LPTRNTLIFPYSLRRYLPRWFHDRSTVPARGLHLLIHSTMWGFPGSSTVHVPHPAPEPDVVPPYVIHDEQRDRVQMVIGAETATGPSTPLTLSGDTVAIVVGVGVLVCGGDAVSVVVSV